MGTTGHIFKMCIYKYVQVLFLKLPIVYSLNNIVHTWYSPTVVSNSFENLLCHASVIFYSILQSLFWEPVESLFFSVYIYVCNIIIYVVIELLLCRLWHDTIWICSICCISAYSSIVSIFGSWEAMFNEHCSLLSNPTFAEWPLILFCWNQCFHSLVVASLRCSINLVYCLISNKAN